MSTTPDSKTQDDDGNLIPNTTRRTTENLLGFGVFLECVTSIHTAQQEVFECN